jgi:Second Longin domain of FUZ, MON1 and HPS1
MQDLVFAILVADGQLITLVRLEKCMLHPVDLHIIFNLITASDAFKHAESWTPVCLPKFDARYCEQVVSFQVLHDFTIYHMANRSCMLASTVIVLLQAIQLHCQWFDCDSDFDCELSIVFCV